MKKYPYKPTKRRGRIVGWEGGHDGHWMIQTPYYVCRRDGLGVTYKRELATLPLPKHRVEPKDYPKIKVGDKMSLPAKRGPRRWHICHTDPKPKPSRYSFTVTGWSVYPVEGSN